MSTGGNQTLLNSRQARGARNALLGEGADPLQGGLDLARVGGFYEGGLGRIQGYQTANGGSTYTTPEMQQVLGQYQGIAQQYANGGRTGGMQDYLNRMKSSIQGYDAPEMQAMREQAQKGIDTQSQTQLAQLRTTQARGGTRGASAAAQQQNLDRTRINAQQDLEQGLFARNADVKNQRLDAYGQALSGAEQNEFNQKMGTQNAYTTALVGQEGRNTDTAKYNLDRLMAERAGAMSSVLTTADLRNRKGNFAQQMALAMKAINKKVPISLPSGG